MKYEMLYENVAKVSLLFLSLPSNTLICDPGAQKLRYVAVVYL